MLGSYYDYRLVALSVVIAVVCSLATLDLAGRVTAARGRERLLWLLGGATAMAIAEDPAQGNQFIFACTANGVAAKCARNWGFRPWRDDHTFVFDAPPAPFRVETSVTPFPHDRDPTIGDPRNLGANVDYSVTPRPS